jgi:hypothetical protein
MIQFTFRSDEPNHGSVLAIWAELTGLTQQELIHAINEGLASRHKGLNIHGPRGTVETEATYARGLVT